MYSKFLHPVHKHSYLFFLIRVALLSGCRNHKNSQLAEEVYNRMIKHFPEAKASITSATILLANTTALSGDTTKSCHVRDQLRRSDMNKSVGLSWSSVNGKFYVSHLAVIINAFIR